MNTVYALMIITATGVTEAPNNFATLADCEKVVQRIQRETYCVAKTPVDTEKEMNKIFAIFKNFQREMMNEK